MINRKNLNPFSGSWFWFKWLALAMIGFVVSIYFWNWLLLNRIGIDFRNPRNAFIWIAVVFGTWFSILMGLMRRQERSMFESQNDQEATITWWLIWIAMTIGSFFLAAWFWTPFLAERLGSIQESANALIWIVAVFGTWLIALTPLMVFMYKKVDQTYEKARIAKEKKESQFETVNNAKFRSIHIPLDQRQLPKAISYQLSDKPFTLQNGHLVTIKLSDGRTIENVFIGNRTELLGLYDQSELTFEANDIVGVELTDLNKAPDFTEKVWLRLDAVEI